MPSGNTWIIVANSSKARLFAAHTLQNIEEKEGLIHPASRAQRGDLASDKPGSTFESRGAGRHAYEEHQSPKEHEAELFAREVSQALNTMAEKGELKRLYLVAGPSFLGLLRPLMSARLKESVVKEVSADMVLSSVEQIREKLDLVVK